MELETSGPEKVLLLEKRKEVLEDVLQLPVLGICSNQPELLKTFSNSEHPHPKIVCHRGAKTFAPENTLSAIDLAIGLGFNIVEIDHFLYNYFIETWIDLITNSLPNFHS